MIVTSADPMKFWNKKSLSMPPCNINKLTSAPQGFLEWDKLAFLWLYCVF